MIPLAKNIKRYLTIKELVVVSIAIAISVSAGLYVFLNLKREVVINDNGKQVVVKTMKTTVREVLEQNGVEIKPEDYMSTSLDARLQKIRKNEIYIKRAVPVRILADGQEIQLMTYRNTIKEALADSPVKLSELDRIVGSSPDDNIVSGMKIKIARVKEDVVSEKSSIPFKVINRENNHLDKGTEKTMIEGKEGIREKIYKIVMKDGKEIARKLVSDGVLSNPVDKIVELGTVLNYKTSRGDTVRYNKVLEMRATAYTASFHDTGKNPGDPGFGITCTGTRVRRGVIAVDPRVIPLGTRVYVETVGRMTDYGYAVAADTGSAIKGNIIDLYYDSTASAIQWGSRRVKVYILAD